MAELIKLDVKDANGQYLDPRVMLRSFLICTFRRVCKKHILLSHHNICSRDRDLLHNSLIF